MDFPSTTEEHREHRTRPQPSTSSKGHPHTSNHHDNDQHGQSESELPRQPWAILALALVAQILVELDISVVNTALPTIGADLHLSGGELQWLVTAYLLMSGGGLLLGGRIADLLSGATGPADRLGGVHHRVAGERFRLHRGSLDWRPAAQGLGAALMTRPGWRSS